MVVSGPRLEGEGGRPLPAEELGTNGLRVRHPESPLPASSGAQAPHALGTPRGPGAPPSALHPRAFSTLGEAVALVDDSWRHAWLPCGAHLRRWPVSRAGSGPTEPAQARVSPPAAASGADFPALRFMDQTSTPYAGCWTGNVHTHQSSQAILGAIRGPEKTLPEPDGEPLLQRKGAEEGPGALSFYFSRPGRPTSPTLRPAAAPPGSPSEHAWPCSPGGGGARLVTINVGGCRMRLAWAALARCPLTRLERLRACRGRDELLRVCDDYDAGRDEFFFDRNPCAFRALAALLRAGKLRLLRGPCATAFRDELAYWGIDEARLEACCLRRLRRREEEAAEARAGSGPGPRRLPAPRRLPDGGRRRLRDVLENPRSGLAGKLFAGVSVSFVAITAVSLCLSTMPDLRAEEERGECSPKCRNLFVLETVCVAWFSFEFLLRSLHAESKCAFLRTPLTILDLLALLPFYVSLLVDLAAGAGPGRSLERAGLGLRLLRALRVLHVVRLARHSLGLRSLGLTVRRCARELGLLLLFLCVAMALFAPLVHLAERELGARHDFSSVPASYWWAVISMTTVGYGDMVPRSVPGQVVALSSILSGILLVAFPVTSIFHTFSRAYAELKEQQRCTAGPNDDDNEDGNEDGDDDSTRSPTEDDGARSPAQESAQAAAGAGAVLTRPSRRRPERGSQAV
ncbi:voltage-gated potassium channel regulatory subunit KCNG2 [Tamandua tetradactyla]|uniref:voltage-gated potassium channel regulatory subunit KCNG2 n=1 Tax=Tamandua tetradactyla TaxID=48850 RepID=UPI004054180A